MVGVMFLAPFRQAARNAPPLWQGDDISTTSGLGTNSPASSAAITLRTSPWLGIPGKRASSSVLASGIFVHFAVANELQR
jgi:hypothetical protein